MATKAISLIFFTGKRKELPVTYIVQFMSFFRDRIQTV